MVSKVAERLFVTAFRVNMAEAAPRSGAYSCFDAFFTRELRPGARTIAGAALVSPADGELRALGPIDGSDFAVKRQSYSVAQLLESTADADRYRGGTYAVVYLSPRDYHRVHSPVDGMVTRVRSIPGDLFPVNAIGEHIPRLLVRNSRVAIQIETKSLGLVSVVMVGAVIVGSMSIRLLTPARLTTCSHCFAPPVAISRGEELGTFHLGSTVVLLLEHGVTITRPLGPICYGQALTREP